LIAHFYNFAGLDKDGAQNRGMALASPFLSEVLFQRLKHFGLLMSEHKACEAVVLDSNGSHLQYYSAVANNTTVFEASSPITVVEVKGAPAALACDGLYTRVAEHLFVQNIDFDPIHSSLLKPHPRIIEYDTQDNIWCFRHLFAKGTAMNLMYSSPQQSLSNYSCSSESHESEPEFFGVREWCALSNPCGNRDGYQCNIEIGFRMVQSPDKFEFKFGAGGCVQYHAQPSPAPVVSAQWLHADGDTTTDSVEFGKDGNILLDTPPICTQSRQQKGFSFFPTSTWQGLNCPLGALFSLMLHTCLGFSDCVKDIVLGSCVLLSTIFPYRGAEYDYINRRLHLRISHLKAFQSIPALNVEQRLRVLACAAQRNGSPGFYDLTLLNNLVFYGFKNDDELPFSVDPVTIVYGEDWIYCGDVCNKQKPHGHGTKVFDNSETECGYFKNGRFVRSCQKNEAAVESAKLWNLLRKLFDQVVRGDDVYIRFEATADKLFNSKELRQHVDASEVSEFCQAMLSCFQSSSLFITKMSNLMHQRDDVSSPGGAQFLQSFVEAPVGIENAVLLGSNVDTSSCFEDIGDNCRDTGSDLARTELNSVSPVASNGVGGLEPNPSSPLSAASSAESHLNIFNKQQPQFRLHIPERTHLVSFGLPNIGGTCHMNASLQCLLHTTKLSRLFLSSDFDGSSLQPKTISDANTIIRNRNVASCFKKFVNCSNTDDLGSIPGMLNELVGFVQTGLAVRDSEYKGGIADSSETFFYLVECICPSMFRCPIESQVTCQACNTTSCKTDEDFLFMNFPPLRRRGVVATFDEGLQSYLNMEVLQDPYGCSICQSFQNAQKQLFLKDLPDFFLLV
jgi:hypothetical protein